MTRLLDALLEVATELDQAASTGALMFESRVDELQGDDPVLRTVAILQLRADVAVPVSELGFEHAVDPQAFLDAMLERHYKPFHALAEQAALAAAGAWDTIVKGGF